MIYLDFFEAKSVGEIYLDLFWTYLFFLLLYSLYWNLKKKNE